MSETKQTRINFHHAGERGGARLKLLIVLFLLAVVGYVAFQYVPVAYHASLLKVYMQDTVNTAATMDKSGEWVRGQFQGVMDEYNIPPDATISAEKQDGRMVARIHFTRAITLPGYIYQYDFDYTARSNNFLAGN